MTQRIEFTILVNSSAALTWKTLTDPEKIKGWMGESDYAVEVITDWKVGFPILINGFHHIKFENRGIVLEFEPNALLRYNYLSSTSRLPDKPENYTEIEFRLTPIGNQTSLKVSLSNFPTESIMKHVSLYWRATIEVIKSQVESENV
jgi:uncharacterized protein YndB with AHSA1/START domain